MVILLIDGDDSHLLTCCMLLLVPAVNCYVAFTPVTCSPDRSCVHLYLLSPSTCILYRRQNCRHGYMYPLVSASRTLLRSGGPVRPPGAGFLLE